MGVTIDEPGKDRHFRQIENLGPVRNGDIGADRLDLRAANENDLVRQNTARLHVDEPAGADGGDGRDGRGCIGGGRPDQAYQRYEGQTQHRQ
jgi:hypothetical protein